MEYEYYRIAILVFEFSNETKKIRSKKGWKINLLFIFYFFFLTYP